MIRETITFKFQDETQRERFHARLTGENFLHAQTNLSAPAIAHRNDRQPPAGLTEAEQLIWNLGFNAGGDKLSERVVALEAALTYIARETVDLPYLSPAMGCELAHNMATKALAGSVWKCGARAQGTAGGNDPADCDWPTCGCDPYATKVIGALQESGALK